MTTVKERALAVGNRLGVKVIPKLPDGAKRLLSGGRAVTIDGNTLDPSLQVLLAAQRATGANGLVIADDAQLSRANFAVLGQTLDERDVRVAEVGQVSIPGPAGTIRARYYRPVAGGTAVPLLVFFHGGGWCIGDLDAYDPVVRTLAEVTGLAFLSVQYRLAPEHPFPAAVQDATTATYWAFAHATDLGFSGVGVAGDSAGGNLAAAVAGRLRGADIPLALQLLLYPSVDLRSLAPPIPDPDGLRLVDDEGSAQVRRWYLAGADPAQPDVSPLLGEVAGVAPTVLAVAEYDRYRPEAQAYAARLRAAGVPVWEVLAQGLDHAFVGWVSFADRPREATEEIGAVTRAALGLTPRRVTHAA